MRSGVRSCLLIPIVTTLAGIGFSQNSVSDELDSASIEALQKTQDLLVNPGQRQQAVANDPKARAHDAKVQSMLGNQAQPTYELSAQILETIVKKTNGDPKAMQVIINQLMSDPAKLEQYLTPPQREQIRGLAGQIENQRRHPPSAPIR